jgi:protein TonB
VPSIDATYTADNLNNPLPTYPPRAFFNQIEGEVLLRVLVLATGQASEVQILSSSGDASLDDSALSTVTQWQFNPAQRNGEAIEQWIEVPIIFSIRRY